jgi:hypothetical protein
MDWEGSWDEMGEFWDGAILRLIVETQDALIASCPTQASSPDLGNQSD